MPGTICKQPFLVKGEIREEILSGQEEKVERLDNNEMAPYMPIIHG